MGIEYDLQAPVSYHFQWCKTTIGWLHRVTWKKRYRVRLKSIVLLQNYKMKSKRIIVVLKYKRNVSFWRNWQKYSIQFSVSRNLWNFYFCPHETGGCFCLRTKKVVHLKQCPLYVLTALGMRKREVYRKQTIPYVSVFLNKVSALEHDRFMQASLCTVSLLFANTLA